MLTTSILIAALAVSVGPASGPPVAAPVRLAADPVIEIWMNRDEVFRRGDEAKVYFRTDVDAYVTIFRIDTDGRVRVLFPIDPWDDNFARGGARYEIKARHGGYAFRVDDYPGEGYVFAVASADPYRYTSYVRGDHWDYRSIGYDGRITGDPYVAFGDILAAIVPENYVAYSYDVTPYFVEQRYAYPRFVCYDCHTYAAYPYWDPYHVSCFKFRLVIYDDPYYYPARYYAGTRVVYRRRTVTVPRYVFKDRRPNDDYVVTVRERPVDDNGRRRIEPGARGRDLGGVGRVPVPLRPDATRPDDPVRRRVESPRTGPGAEPRRVEPVRPKLERRDPVRRNGPETGRRVEPRRTEPSRAIPQRSEPRRVEPRRTEPGRATPQRSEPRRVEPRRVEPRRNGPSRTSPQQSTPRRAEPRRNTRRSPPRRPPPKPRPRRAPPKKKKN